MAYLLILTLSGSSSMVKVTGHRMKTCSIMHSRYKSRQSHRQLKCRPELESLKGVRVVGATSSEGFCSLLALSFVLARHLQTNLCYSFSGVVKSSPVSFC